MKIQSFQTQYCEFIPNTLKEGVLYISTEYKLATHLCACGCGIQTVTSLGPGEWDLKDNGHGFITLTPSIGNFKGEQPYHAHYYITNSRVEWL